MEVYHPRLKRTFHFPCNDWLADKEGPGGRRRELLSGAALAASGPTTYK